MVPLRVTGLLRSPAVKTDTAGAIADNAGTVAGVLLGDTSPLGAIAGALGGQKLLGGGGEGADCSSALAIARGQAGGAAAVHPAAQPSPSPAAPKPKPKAPNVGNLLHQLFR